MRGRRGSRWVAGRAAPVICNEGTHFMHVGDGGAVVIRHRGAQRVLVGDIAAIAIWNQGAPGAQCVCDGGSAAQLLSFAVKVRGTCALGTALLLWFAVRVWSSRALAMAPLL